jgi:hypothetical protein
VINLGRSLVFSSIACVLISHIPEIWGGERVSVARTKTLVLALHLEHRSETNLVLHARLTNVSTNVLAIPLGYLPWDRYAMSVVLVETDPTSIPIKQQRVIADPPPGEPHRIEGGQTIEGEIDLNSRYPELYGKLKKGDMLLFWSYKPSEEHPMERVGGWCLVEQIK